MKYVKVAAGVVNQTPLDWTGNKNRILQTIAHAQKSSASILCLPELCITGYGCEDAFFSPFVHDKALQILKQILPHTVGLVVTLGLPIFHQGAIFNTTAVIANGQILGFIPKKQLAGDGVHYENRWFKTWPNDVYDSLKLDGLDYPFGDFFFEIGDIRIGLEICEEAWVAKRTGAQLAQKATDIILNPSASHFAFGKHEVRKRFVLEGSRAFGVAYVYTNLVGNESGRIIFDGGALIASNGQIVLQSPRFSFADSAIYTAVIDVEMNRTKRAQTASFTPLMGTDPSLIRVPFSWLECKPEISHAEVHAWEQSADIKNEEFYRAEVLALFDYLRKSRSSGFAVSLSGGVDSAVCATLAAKCFECAAKEIGLDQLKTRLAYIPKIDRHLSLQSLTKQMVLTLYQSTQNSSNDTRNAATKVAFELGTEHHQWNIDGLLKEYHSRVETIIGRPLSWATDDIALQNVQARVRSPGVWMLANLRGALLLATSNRSEAAVGYATMDGDTSGGLSPIAGVDKAFLQTWIRWMAEHGPADGNKVASLAEVYKVPPSAELRPPEKHQTDEADLMPYSVLDAIERAFIRDRKAPLEILSLLKIHFPQFPPEMLRNWTSRFLRLWAQNQWKRERYAPAFHLDDESLDPKTWCRFPILSNGFIDEIEDIKNWNP